MLINFFLKLKSAKLPASLRELLMLLEALDKNFVQNDVESFYYLARSSLVKSERNIDKFDRVFKEVFDGIESISLESLFNTAKIPEDWIKKLAEKLLSKSEMEQIKSHGSLEELLKTLQKRLEEQKKRHQGGNKWIGTAGTSPFGAYGFNPEGIRIGQHESRHQRATKVWDKRQFQDLDDHTELSSRGMKLALKRLRKWAKDKSQEEVDINETISATAKSGYLDVKTKPERRNAVKLLLFLDIGGSMDSHVNEIQSLFSAAQTAFKTLDYFYFHNCLYEGVWQKNIRRWSEQVSTYDILRTYGKDYKCIFVGDASMSPYEIEVPGGGNEHYNAESGRIWLERARNQWPSNIWVNPVPEENWKYSESTLILRKIFENKMVPLTLTGLESGMRELSK